MTGFWTRFCHQNGRINYNSCETAESFYKRFSIHNLRTSSRAELRTNIRWNLTSNLNIPKLLKVLRRVGLDCTTYTSRCPRKWSKLLHNRPMIPAPITNILEPICTDGITSIACVIQDSGSHSAAEIVKYHVLIEDWGVKPFIFFFLEILGNSIKQSICTIP